MVNSASSKISEQTFTQKNFVDNQMVYLLALHTSALQTDSTKLKHDFIGLLFVAPDKTHYRLKDVTGLLLDGKYHMNRIKKSSAHTDHWRIWGGGGHARHTPPLMGPNSFIFAYIFTKKCPHRRSTAPLMVHAPPYARSWFL